MQDASVAAVVVSILEWAARGSILVVVWMLRMLFKLDQEKELLKQDLEREKLARESAAKLTAEQRREFLALVKDTNEKVEKLRDEQNSAHRELLTAIHTAAAGNNQ